MRKKIAVPGTARGAFRALAFFLFCIAVLWPGMAPAQNNYEIQVYPSGTMAPKTLLIELHSNYTIQGTTATQFGMLPTQGQEHEIVEFTEGLNDWSELGFYVFTAAQNGHGVQWVGDHIRPRVRIPAPPSFTATIRPARISDS